MPRLTPARGLVRPSAAPGPLTRDLGRVSILPRVKFRAVSAQKLDPAKGIEGAFEIVRPISRNLRRSVGAYIQILAEGVSAEVAFAIVRHRPTFANISRALSFTRSAVVRYNSPRAKTFVGANVGARQFGGQHHGRTATLQTAHGADRRDPRHPRSTCGRRWALPDGSARRIEAMDFPVSVQRSIARDGAGISSLRPDARQGASTGRRG